jgi:hypothetical protein
MPEPLPTRQRVGQWPAAAVIFGFAVCELCWATGREPRALAIIMLLYFVVSLVGMSIYGVEAWTRNADGFGVLFRPVRAPGAVGRRDGGSYARPPVSARRAEPVSGTSRAAPSIGSTALRRRQGGAAVQRRGAARAGRSSRARAARRARRCELGFVLGLSLAIGVRVAIWCWRIEGMPRVRGLTPGSSRRLAHSLIPIVAAYLVAALLLAAGLQRPGPVAAGLRPARQRLGPVRRRRTRDRLLDRHRDQIWYVQVGALVLGHVSALVLAHDRGAVLYGGSARRPRPRSSC